MGIAVAVLEELRRKGCLFVVTTHYPEVKEYGERAEGVINARMAFDKESLKPLYRLELGEAGESCAFYIARRLGMSEETLQMAWKAAYGNGGQEKKALPDITEDKEETQKERKQNPKNKKISRIRSKEEEQKAGKHKQEDIKSRFQIGDSVMVYPQRKLGIVFAPADDRGDVGVQIQKRKLLVNYKRLQLKVAASQMYPEDYDFSIIFDTVENLSLIHISLQIFDFNQGPFVSQDEGKTWTKKYDDWSGMVGEGYFMNAAAAKDGSLFLVYSTYDAVSSEEGEEASQEEVSDAERSEQPDTEPTETEDTEVQVEESDMFTIDCHYMFVSPEGETREIMLPFDMDNYELITNCWYTPDGRLLASQGGAIYEINQEDGSLTVLFETDGDADTACFSDTQMVAFTNTKAYRFDLVKGELMEQDEAVSYTHLLAVICVYGIGYGRMFVRESRNRFGQRGRWSLRCGVRSCCGCFGTGRV